MSTIPEDIEVDEKGCPVEMTGNGAYAKHCPPNPCFYCKGDSAILRAGVDQAELRREGKPLDYLSSWEWCQEMKTCAATVDWDKVYGHDA